MGVDRKQGDDDTDAGYRCKYRKEKGAEYFFVQSLQGGRYPFLINRIIGTNAILYFKRRSDLFIPSPVIPAKAGIQELYVA